MALIPILWIAAILINWTAIVKVALNYHYDVGNLSWSGVLWLMLFGLMLGPAFTILVGIYLLLEAWE